MAEINRPDFMTDEWLRRNTRFIEAVSNPADKARHTTAEPWDHPAVTEINHHNWWNSPIFMAELGYLTGNLIWVALSQEAINQNAAIRFLKLDNFSTKAEADEALSQAQDKFVRRATEFSQATSETRLADGSEAEIFLLKTLDQYAYLIGNLLDLDQISISARNLFVRTAKASVRRQLKFWKQLNFPDPEETSRRTPETPLSAITNFAAFLEYLNFGSAIAVLTEVTRIEAEIQKELSESVARTFKPSEPLQTATWTAEDRANAISQDGPQGPTTIEQVKAIGQFFGLWEHRAGRVVLDDDEYETNGKNYAMALAYALDTTVDKSLGPTLLKFAAHRNAEPFVTNSYKQKPVQLSESKQIAAASELLESLSYKQFRALLHALSSNAFLGDVDSDAAAEARKWIEEVRGTRGFQRNDGTKIPQRKRSKPPVKVVEPTNPDNRPGEPGPDPTTLG